MNVSSLSAKMPWYRRKFFRRLLMVLGILLVLRISLPFIILHFVNKKLQELNGYYGHVSDVNLALIRGAYVIRDIRIEKVDPAAKDSTLFFYSPRIDLSVEWRALFRGKLVGEVVFERPELYYTAGKTIGRKAPVDSVDFIKTVQDFIPLRINHFLVEEGKIFYEDRENRPPVELNLSDLFIEGEGLTNKPEPDLLLPASLRASGNLYGGLLRLSASFDPLARKPAFDLDAEMDETDLVYLNPVFRAYANFDVSRGRLSLFSEFAAKEGSFEGYVKPLIHGLDVVEFSKNEGSPLQITWEVLVGTAAEIFENQRKDQLGSRIPVKGRFKRPEVDVLTAILAVLRNAFVEALKPSIEHSVSLRKRKR